jgi:hemoglobin-like flavoprotein
LPHVAILTSRSAVLMMGVDEKERHDSCSSDLMSATPRMDDVNKRPESGLVRRSHLAETEVLLIDDSYARLEPRLSCLAAAFWARTLSARPALARLFSDELEQRDVAVSFFSFVVTNLRATDVLCELLERMGQRGLLQHVTASEVEVVVESLLDTLREFEGDRWTVDTAHAWAVALTWTSATIRRGSATKRALRSQGV